MNNFRKIVVWLGLRSRCCYERLEYYFGWDYRLDGIRCSKCGNAK